MSRSMVAVFLMLVSCSLNLGVRAEARGAGNRARRSLGGAGYHARKSLGGAGNCATRTHEAGLGAENTLAWHKMEDLTSGCRSPLMPSEKTRECSSATLASQVAILLDACISWKSPNIANICTLSSLLEMP
jgi:hypothetical protein